MQRDLSNPTYKFINRLNAAMFAGTPYAHDPLGTKASFDATTGAQLKDFYDKWYSPSNMILVVVGDVDAAKTLAEIKQLYSAVPNHAVPARPAIDLQPFKSDSFTIDSNLPYVLGFIAYRMPGTDSPDYAAAQILGGCVGEPARGFVRNGSGGQGAGGGIRLRRGLSQGECRLRGGGAAGRGRCQQAQ